jgi:uncharacterized protein
MRVPTVEPRRRSRFRLRGWIIGIVVVLVVLLFSLRGLAGFYTDFLWFDSLGQGNTWSSLLAARVAPALVFTVVFFVIMFVNLVIADRLAPKYRAMGPEDELIARYQQVAGPYTMRIRIGVSIFFALIAGIGVSSQWKQWILFTNYKSFDRVDPQFHKDIGFYVFQLPFLKFIAEWLFAGLVIVLIVTAVEHYLNGGIRFQSPFQRVTPQVKAHLSVILAVMALVKTAQYYLGRFELNFSTRGVVEGASATDVKAQLPALNLLIFISIGAAVLFLWNIRRRGWVLPIIAVGLWAFVSLVIGTIYPAAYQQFRVGPNEYQAESKYIDRNIRATRDAFGLDQVQSPDYDYASLKTLPQAEAQELVDSNSGTVNNARLWDPNVIRDTYSTLQNLQTYYQIGDVDVDRYLIDGKVQQVLIAARGLNSADLPSQSFVNRHIVYTHGYGAVASPSNDAQADGNPDFLLRDVPVKENGITMDGGPPSEIYFAENLGSYVLTGAEQAEFNYQREGATDQFTRYKGKDGVKLSNFVRRAAFALRFGSLDPLISGQITSNTKILLERDIRARVEKLAPFLEFDADPYPVVLGDKTVWILDGYTTSDRYPYSQALGGEGALPSSFNYVRNSVKVTVDAYEGTVTFYVFDKKDPIVQAYESAFPDLFTPASQMPDEIREHLRYPEDLFKSQADIFGRYHVTEPKRFYDGSAKWLVSPDPGSGRVSNDIISEANAVANSASASASDSNTPQAATSTGARIEPYYLNIRLPGQRDTDEHFVLLVPFVPVSSANSQTRLVSYLAADSDPGQYGKLSSFTMPQGQTVEGPVQVNNNIVRTGAISQAITFFNQQGSAVIQGSMQLIPVGNSLIYVRPFYTQGRGEGSYPLFQFVVVYSQGYGAFCGPTVQDGLDQMLGRKNAVTTCNVSSGAASGGTGTGSPGTTTTTTPGTATTTPATTAPTTTTVPATTDSKQDLLNRAADALDRAQAALEDNDLGTYQQLVEEAQTLVKQAQTAQ